MKRFIAGTCLLSFLIISPHAAQAQIASAERSVLLQQIQILVDLIESLHQQIFLRKQNAGLEGQRITAPLPQPKQESNQVTNSLDSFPSAESTWMDEFVTDDDDIPMGEFRAFYFDSTNPGEVILTEVVSRIGISYPWSDGPGFTLDSEDFGGYWVGMVSVPEDAVYTLNVAESWSDTRVLIDGRIILEGQGSKNVLLKAGTHLLEAEFLNNWHTTDFSVTLTPERVLLGEGELASKIEPLGSFVNWYVGAYESDRNDRGIDVTLQRSSSPVLLTLASYSQAHWEVAAADLPVAVIVSSYEPGSTVSGLPSSVPVYFTDYNVIEYEYQLDVDCYDYEGIAFKHCEDIDQLTKIDSDLEAVTGRKVDGFSGDYGLSSVTVPEIIISESRRDSYEQQYQDARDEHEETQRSQSIDSLF